jgi:transcription factor C subunit 6
MDRRSAHRSTPRRKYTVDAFEGIEELQDVRSEHEVEIGLGEDDDSAEEFIAAVEPSSDLDNFSGAEDAVDEDEPVSDGVSDAGERLLDETMSIADEDLDITPKATPNFNFRQVKFHSRTLKGETSGPKTHTRGAGEQGLGGANLHHRRKLCFGDTPEDISPAIDARNYWASEPTLPSRSTNKQGPGGMHGSFYVDKEAVIQAADEESKAWAKHGGMNLLFKKQRLVDITEEQVHVYHPDSDSAAAFVMGPLNNQKLFKLHSGGSMSLTDAWDAQQTNGSDQTNAQRSNYKSGFMLNLGSRVHCLDWVPHQDGPNQYLAASVLPKRDSSRRSSEAPTAPAFTPQNAHKSSVQLWTIRRRKGGTIDTPAGCRLSAMLCTAWGDVKELKFCPMPIKGTDSSNENQLGLLAGLWGDGAVRVLRIKTVPQDGNTSYTVVEKAAFESRPPDTVCTCITWLSSTRIAVGCANGFVAIWDLPSSIKSGSANPRPTVYASISSSYILSITSCYPSRPHLLLTVSMAGYTTITDTSRSGQSLGSPANTAFSNRVRVNPKGLEWCDYLQLALHIDDNYMLKGAPLRRIFTNMGLARAKSNITSLANSPCHPFILIGSASGEVFSTNPLKRVIDAKPPVWQQTWFTHEWRRPTAEELTAANASQDSTADTASNDAGLTIGANGLSRISEGYKVERNILAKGDRNEFNTHNGVLFATVFEENSAITALAWNPNLEVGGWAAAGMGDGLLRVEDIAI